MFLQNYGLFQTTSVYKPLPSSEYLVAYYTMQGNSNDSINSFNGTDNSVSYNNGKIGECAYFDEGGYIEVSTGGTFTFSGGTFTISCWVRNSSTPTNVYKIFQFGTTFGQISSTYTNKVMFTTWGGELQELISNASLPLNSWTHYVFVLDSTTGKTLYINGELDNTSSDTLTYEPGNFFIGGLATGSYTIDGAIDEMGVWIGYALTQEDVTNIYNNGYGTTV